MARPRPRTASYGNRSDVQNSPSLGILPLRPSPAPATIIQNLAASLVGSLQEDVRCACHIEKNLYTGDTLGAILKWTPVDASRVTFNDGLGAPVNVVVSVNENKEIWAGLANGNITIITLETQSIKHQIIHAHDAAVNCIAVGIQSAWSGGDDFLIKKWDLEGVELFAYNQHHGYIKDLLILRKVSAEVRLWGASSDTSISVSALQDSRVQHSLTSDVKMLSGHSKGVLALCLVGTDAIWSGSEDGTIYVWSSLGVLKKQMQAHKGPVGSFVVMGAHIWSGSGDHTVLVWESSSYQLLFSLGDHGGFVKAMVRVEYMCWVFASGKNVRIWCAQSVWDTYEGEKNRLLLTLERLKESLAKADRNKQALEGAGKKSQQDLQQTQQQLNEQRSSGASALEKKNAELEKLKSELAQTLKDLETSKESAERNAGSLDDEIKLILEKLSKLKAGKESGEKEAKAKIEGLEKELGEAEEKHNKGLRDLAALNAKLKNMENELQMAQGDLENSRKMREGLLAKQNLDNQQISELEKSLKHANGRNQALEDELNQSMKDKQDADKAGTSAQAGYQEELGDLQTRIKQLQDDLDKAHEYANTNLTAKDAEIQKLQNDMKKKAKELKKALKEAGEEKKRSARDVEELKAAIDLLRKNQDASSSAEASTTEKLVSLALELQAAREELQKTLSDRDQSLEERDSAMKKMGEDHLISMNDLEKALKDLQAENENLRELMKENEKSVGASNEALENELNKTRALLAEASKERDEAGEDATDLRAKIQEVAQNIMQLKDSATANDGSSQALAKEKHNLLTRLNDAASEIQKLKDDLSQLAQSEASQASTLEELRKAGEKGLNDIQDSEQKRASLEKRLEEEQKKTSEEIAEISDALDALKEEKAKLEGLLAQTTSEMEKLRAEKASQEGETAKLTQELNQLKKEKAVQEGQLARKAAELEQVSRELNELKKDKAILEEKLAQKATELEQAVQQKSLQQTTDSKRAKEIEELIRQNALLEEELKKRRLSQDDNASQKANAIDQMEKEMERLRSDIRQKQDDYRFEKESAMLGAADAARRIEDLQSKITRLEMKLEDALTISQAMTSVDDPVWARIRELETALMQAHMDYRLLNQEIRHMRKKKGRHRDNNSGTAGMSPPGPGDGLDVALKLMQPGFCMDYTKLKVSSVGNRGSVGQGRVVKNVEVYAQTSNPETPPRIVPIRAPVSHLETPQRTIPIRVPSPGPAIIEPIITPRPQTKEKERYFPSHGPMRVRRGLSP